MILAVALLTCDGTAFGLNSILHFDIGCQFYLLNKLILSTYNLAILLESFVQSSICFHSFIQSTNEDGAFVQKFGFSCRIVFNQWSAAVRVHESSTEMRVRSAGMQKSRKDVIVGLRGGKASGIVGLSRRRAVFKRTDAVERRRLQSRFCIIK